MIIAFTFNSDFFLKGCALWVPVLLAVAGGLIYLFFAMPNGAALWQAYGPKLSFSSIAIVVGILAMIFVDFVMKNKWARLVVMVVLFGYLFFSSLYLEIGIFPFPAWVGW